MSKMSFKPKLDELSQASLQMFFMKSQIQVKKYSSIASFKILLMELSVTNSLNVPVIFHKFALLCSALY